MWENTICKSSIHRQMRPWRKHLKNSSRDERVERILEEARTRGDLDMTEQEKELFERKLDNIADTWPNRIKHEGKLLHFLSSLGSTGLYTEQELDNTGGDFPVMDLDSKAKRYTVSLDDALEGAVSLDEEQ